MSKQRLKYVLCGRKGTCCPTFTELESGDFELRDDFGGKVLLTPEQIKLMQPVIDHVNKNTQCATIS